MWVTMLPELLLGVLDAAVSVSIVGYVNPALSVLGLIFGLLYFFNFSFEKLIIFLLLYGKLLVNIDILNL